MSLGYRTLPGLPPYGPAVASLPLPGAFSEGLVVEFTLPGGETWTVNLARGEGGTTAVFTALGPRSVVAVAAGNGYVLDLERRALLHELRPWVRFAELVPARGLVVVANGIEFEAVSAGGLAWQSRRISWDGLRNLVVGASHVTGEAYSPIGDYWSPFQLDLSDGSVKGGPDDVPD